MMLCGPNRSGDLEYHETCTHRADVFTISLWRESNSSKPVTCWGYKAMMTRARGVRRVLLSQHVFR
eukprot:257523-Amphidinium_carterae.2